MTQYLNVQHVILGVVFTHGYAILVFLLSNVGLKLFTF